MDVEVRAGAIPALIPAYPAVSSNAGSGNIGVRRSMGSTELVPWNILGDGRSRPYGHIIVLAAADRFFSVADVAAELDAPGTTCIDDPDRCDLVTDALSRSRIYLGFFNVSQTEVLVGGSSSCVDPPYLEQQLYCGPPPQTPYLRVVVGDLHGDARAGSRTGDTALNALTYNDAQPPVYYIAFLPEPSRALLLAGAFSLLVPLRFRSRQ